MDNSEIELNHSYQVGIYAGLHQAAVLVMSEATKLFEQKRDDQARYLRELADKFAKMANDAHPGIK